MFRALPLVVLALLLPACADEGFGRVPGVAATLPPPPQFSPDAAATGSLYNPASFTGLASDRRARRVADARIRYSGSGQVADQSRQGWLARFFAKVVPL